MIFKSQPFHKSETLSDFKTERVSNCLRIKIIECLFQKAFWLEFLFEVVLF